MNEVVVDTSVWVEFFRGTELPELELFLEEGRVLMSPVVVAELISGTKKAKEQEELKAFLEQFEILDCGFNHWFQTGKLRSQLRQKGFQVSTPDSHLAQCAIENKAFLYSFDKIFKKISGLVNFKLVRI